MQSSSSACSPDEGAGPDSTLADPGQLRTVAIPPERLTPFCQGIADLDDRLAEVPAGGDTAEIIIDAYSAIVDEVPPEIRDDFLTVLAGLQEDTTDVAAGASSSTSSSTTVVAPGTTLEDFEEGYTPDDSPALRLNAYVQFVCRDGQNNPGPPDTEPIPHRWRRPSRPDTNARASATPAISSTTVRGHVPRCARRSHPRQAGGDHGRDRLDADLRRARRRRQSLEPAVPVGRSANPATTSPSASRTTPASSRSSSGCEYAGLIYTAASSRLTTDELTYIVNDCGARVFITSTYKAEQAAELLDTTPDVELRLMLDGVIDGYESYEETVAQQSAEPLDERVAGTDMLYSSGTTGRPKGVLPVLQREPLETRVTPVAGMLRALVRHGRHEDVPVAGTDVPRRTAAVLDVVALARGHGRRAWSTSTPSATSSSSSATGRRTPRSCRPCSCAC